MPILVKGEKFQKSVYHGVLKSVFCAIYLKVNFQMQSSTGIDNCTYCRNELYHIY